MSRATTGGADRRGSWHEHPDGVDAIHTNMLFVTPSWLEDPMAMLDEERGTYRETSKFPETGSGYQEIQSTRPQTLVYGLTDSPAGLAGWITEKFRAWSGDDVDATIVRD